MKKVFNYFVKGCLKALALVALSVLTIVNSVLKALIFVFRLLTIPVVVGVSIFVIANWIIGGFDPEFLIVLAVLIGITVLYYVLPYLSPSLEHTLIAIRTYTFSPITIKSPVKYTM